jgi:heat shock protein HtpX
MSMRGVVFLGLLSALFAALGSLFGLVGAAFALAIAIVLAFWSYWSFGPELIHRTGARPVSDLPTLALLHDLARRAGIPQPDLYEIEDPQPNALAVGPNADASIIIITSELRRRLSEDELAGVLAHEIAHIRNKDVFAAALAATCVSAVFVLAIPLALLGIVLRRRGGGILTALAILTPFAALILRCSMARSVEYRADRDAAYLCGDANHVVLALRRIGSHRRPCELALREPVLASMLFVSPLPKTWLGRLLSSHPPIERRIARLRALPGNRY